jgi:hypothetical protein
MSAIDVASKMIFGQPKAHFMTVMWWGPVIAGTTSEGSY